MATALEKKPCAKCEKGRGVTTCDGCQQSFCIKHIIEHRQDLTTQMDNIGQEHDSLRRDLIQEDWIHPLLLQINKWEQESIKKIQVAAEVSRDILRQLLDQMDSDVKISIDKMADELQTYRGSDDYTEIDLTRWSAKLTDIRKLWEAPLTIKIVEDENMSTAIRLVKVFQQKQLNLSSNSTSVSEKSLLPSQQLFGSTQEIFDAVMKPISLSKGGLLATYTGEVKDYYKTIFGKNLYSSGICHIHFRVENKDIDNLFFGIVTSSQNLEGRIFNTSSANGWWGFDLSVIDGKNQTVYGEKILQTGDVVKLTLDCDNKRIRFENYRTKTTTESPIDLAKCPLPWKIAISLSRPHDTLRILW